MTFPHLSLISLTFLSTLIVLLPTSTALSLPNITLPLPAGTTNHNTPGLICTPMEWTDLAGFYLLNYVAHAATVLTRPGERAWDFAVTVFGSLLFPALGLYRGMDAIFSGAVFCRDELRRAARSSALCCVVRGCEWEPRDGEEVGKGVLRRGDADGDVKGQDEEKDPRGGKQKIAARVLTYAPPWLLTKFGFPVYVHRQIIHGTYELPKGYCFATVPYDVQFKPLANGQDASGVEIAATYNMVKALVALGQTIYASITLYRARGNQIEKFGYAAFGLTVAPYAVMSIVNLAGNLCRPEYACLYMVESGVMDEARARGGFFHGALARVEEEEVPSVCGEGTAEGIQDVEDVGFVTDEKGGLRAYFNTVDASSIIPRLQTYILPPGSPDPGEEKICKSPTTISSTSTSASTLSGTHIIPLLPLSSTSPHTPTDTILLIPSCAPFLRSSPSPILSPSHPPTTLRTLTLRTQTCWTRVKSWTPSWTPSMHSPTISPRLQKYTLTLFLSLLPLLLNGILSHFSPGSIPLKESSTWKGYTMQWLCFGVVGGLWWVLDQETKDASVKRVPWFGPKTRAAAYFMSASPAIGGFVVVGQMFRVFGDCTWVGG